MSAVSDVRVVGSNGGKGWAVATQRAILNLQQDQFGRAAGTTSVGIRPRLQTVGRRGCAKDGASWGNSSKMMVDRAGTVLKSTYPIFTIIDYWKIQMLRQMETKLAAFASEFGEVEPLERQGHSGRGIKLQRLGIYLQNEEYLISFSESMTLYRLLLEQDKTFHFRQKKNWHRQEVRVLVFMVCQFCLKHDIEIERISGDAWAQISTFLPGRSSDDCKFKWLSLLRHPAIDYSWEPEEEMLLRQILRQIDYENERPRWNKVAKVFNTRSHRNAYLYRTSRELKKKWISSICPVEKGHWRRTEDLVLFESVRDHGKKWSYISKLMKELRTENGVKNRYLSVIDKEIGMSLGRRKNSPTEEELVLRIIAKIKVELGLQEKVDQAEDAEKNDEEQHRGLKPTGALTSSTETQLLSPNPTGPTYNTCQYILQPMYCQPAPSFYSPPVYMPVILNWAFPQAVQVVPPTPAYLK